jgi:heptosyltransferase-2
VSTAIPFHLRLTGSALGAFAWTVRHTVPRPRRVDGRVAPSAAHAPRILVVRLDELGDMVLASGFFRELRRHHPAAHITLVASAPGAEIMAGSPHLDRVIAFRESVAAPLRPLLMPFIARRFAHRYLSDGPYDLAIQPRWDVDTRYASWIVHFSAANRRVAYASCVTPRKSVFNRGLDGLFTTVIDDRAVRHESDRGSVLLAALGFDTSTARTEVWPKPAPPRAHIEAALARLSASAGPVVAMSPSGGHSALKAWPVERFALVARALSSADRATIVLLGAPADRHLADELRALAALSPGQVVDLVGRTTLEEIVSILDLANVYIGNDTGLVHIASARGRPTVSMYGSSPASSFGPRGERDRVIWLRLPCGPPFNGPPYARHGLAHGLPAERCTACIHARPRCLDDIGVEEVLDACRAALHATAHRSAS